ncbi:sulfotransferase family protein [Stieleria sp. JC731]|uniref:sulfotransferase family 2 domain-containing protein n=1 Tax=Pirellulaceae TaxID=2691357 RepID=UPI001E4D313E|nr:sulfotransferase family 2 domain-containing protein [Stieleria sp. JC731]MCC9601113.1 sulfotransferase family protein [Stieleria sp. JC731]
MSAFKKTLLQTSKFAKLCCVEPGKELRQIFHKGPAPAKIAFDHLPKCGGSSLNHFLESNFLWRQTFSTCGSFPRTSIEKFHSLSEQQRQSYRLIKGHLVNQLFGLISDDFLKITILRDPVDRIVSHYFYVKRRPTHYLYPRIEKEAISLEEFVSLGLSDELSNWYTLHFSGWSETAASENPKGAVDAAFSSVVNTYNVVGFLDRYDRFVECLQSIANLVVPNSGGKKNVTSGRVSVKQLEAKTRDVIQEHNEMDTELYRRLRSIDGFENDGLLRPSMLSSSHLS